MKVGSKENKGDRLEEFPERELDRGDSGQIIGPNIQGS